MYSFRVDDNVTKKAITSIDSSNKKNKTIEDLVDGINNINHSLDVGGSTADVKEPNFTRLDQVVIDDDQIKNQAETELKEYKTSSIDKINKDTESKLDKVTKDKQTLKENYDSTISSLDKYYDSARNTVSNDALSRGLARSSIVINELQAFTNEQLNTYAKLNEELNDNITALDFEISTLEEEKDKALSQFDIEYAEKLTSKIASLKQNLLDKQEEVIKYNNEIEEKETQFNMDYNKLVSDLEKADWSKQSDIMDIVAKYGTNVIEKYKSNQVLNLLDDYFSGKSKSVINYELKYNSALREALGKYYDTALKYYGG